jgi:hypothetical protein
MKIDLDLSLEVIRASYFLNVNFLQSAMKAWQMQKFVGSEMLYSNRSSKNVQLKFFLIIEFKATK